MSSRQWESFFGCMGWSGGTFGVGAYTDGYSAGYLINGNHAIGATTIALKDGTGQLPPGTVLHFGANAYTVLSSVGGTSVTSITIAAPGLVEALANNAAVESKIAAGPSDQMCYLLAGHLAADPVIAAALGGRIERMGIEPASIHIALPRLYIYPGSVDQAAVAQIADKDCDVIAALAFGVTALTPPSSGSVTVASMLTRIEHVAQQHNQMTVQLSTSGNNEQVLADGMEVLAYQTAALDEKDPPQVLAQLIQFRYRNVTRTSDGRIWQIAKAA